MVIGAMPMPADTSDTARLRCVSNQPVTQAIIGAKIAGDRAADHQAEDELELEQRVARLASARLAGQQRPSRSARRGAARSGRRASPQTMLASAMRQEADGHGARDAGDRPAGVACEIGRRNTGSENIAPIATQPSRPPAATITQRYGLSHALRQLHAT